VQQSSGQLSGLQTNQLILLGMIVAVAASLIAPIWLAANEPTQDGPSHVNALYILLNIGKEPILARYYRVEWALVPNLAAELVVPVLATTFTLSVAIKLFLSLSVFFWVVGPSLIQRALFGHLQATSLVAAMFAYNTNFLMGFWSFYFGLGLSLVLFAIWIWWSRRPTVWQVIYFAAAMVTIYFCHIVAALALFVLLGIFELTRTAAESHRWPATRRSLVRLAAIALPAVCFFILRPHTVASQGVDWQLISGFPERFGSILKTGVGEPQWRFVLALIAFMAIGLRARFLYIHPSTRIVLITFALLCLVMPVEAAGGWGVHERYPALLFALLLASTDVRLPHAIHNVLTGAAMLLVLVLAAALNRNWQLFDRKIDEFRAALHKIPVGSTVFTVEDDTPGRRSESALYWHMESYVIADRQGFSSLLLTTRGQHIIHPNPNFERMAALTTYEAAPPQLSALPRLRVTTTNDADLALFHGNILNWQCRFDVVAVIELVRRTRPVPTEFELIHQGSFFALYRVRRPATCLEKI